MADVPCLDYSLDDCKDYPDDVQTTKHAQRMHAWSKCARTSLGAHVSLFGTSSVHFLNRDARDERANRRTEHGEQSMYQTKRS